MEHSSRLYELLKKDVPHFEEGGYYLSSFVGPSFISDTYLIFSFRVIEGSGGLLNVEYKAKFIPKFDDDGIRHYHQGYFESVSGLARLSAEEKDFYGIKKICLDKINSI